MPAISFTYRLTEIDDIARRLLAAAKPDKLLLFYGEMGAGKTTLIKALCNCLGVTGNVSSPTFSIVNEYSSPQGSVYHFDFYRLKNEFEALDMGYEEYFYSGEICLIEWPEKIASLLPPRCVKLSITNVDQHTRTVTLDKI